MSISYANTSFSFVDSQYGTASNQNIKSLVNVEIDRAYHKQVQKKLIWNRMGMIGPDTYTEGTGNQTAPGYPVIRKDQLTNEPGDTIKMGMRTNLSFGTNTGKTGADQLVDSEVAPDFYNLPVRIDRWRQGVRFNDGMDTQRNPYEPFEQMEMSLLADWSSQQQDNSLTYAANYGYAPHSFREQGTTNLVPAEPGNILIGNDQSFTTTQTISALSGTGQDNIKGITFEIGATFCEQNDFDPVVISGQPYWLVFVSPMGIQRLYRDDEFRKTALFARERGDDNMLFKSAEFAYYNCLIFRYDKIRTLLGGNNPAGMTVSGKQITEATYTSIGGGVTSAQLHQTLFFGANALALAEGRYRMANRIRKEDDYMNIIGRATDNIFGTRRADFKSEDGTVTQNQSLLKMINSLV